MDRKQPMRSRSGPTRRTRRGVALYAALAGVGVCYAGRTATAAQVTSDWRTGAFGAWTTTANWSTQPYFPNNGFPSTTSTYAANIAAPGVYTVTLNTRAITVDSLTIAAARATFNQTGQTLTAGAVSVTAGSYNLLGNASLVGSGTAATLNVSSSAAFNVTSGTLSNLTLGSGTTVSMPAPGSVLSVLGGLKTDGAAAVNVTGRGSTLRLFGSQTLTGIAINVHPVDPIITTANFIYLDAGINSDTVTIGPTSSIAGSAFVSGYNLQNQGTVTADTADGILQLQASSLTSAGTLAAKNGGRLFVGVGGSFANTGAVTVDGASAVTINGNWSNAGTITAAPGGTVNLGGRFATADLAGVAATGAAVNISGTVDNSSGGFTVDAEHGNLTLSGTINGGTVDVRPGRTLAIDAGTVYADTAVQTGGTITGGSPAQVGLQGVFYGPGIVNHGTISATSNLLLEPVSLTSDGTLSAVNGGFLVLYAQQWTSSGSITTDGSSTVVLDSAWTNTGTISGVAGGTIVLNGTFSKTSIGTLTPNGADVVIGGGFDNADNVFTSRTAGSLAVNGGTVTGGQITPPAGQPLVVSHYGLLSGVRVNGDLVVATPDSSGSTYAMIADGTVVATGNIAVQPGGVLSFVGTQTLDAARVALQGTLNGDDLTLGDASTVTVTSGGTGASSSITATAFTNRGTITVGTAATLIATAPTFTNAGTLSLAGGSLYRPGTLDVGDGTLTGTGMVIADLLQFDGDPSTLLSHVTSATIYDQIAVTGDVTLGGNLSVVFVGGVDPSIAASDGLVILTGTNLSGAFLNVASGGRLETADGLGSFEVDYGGTGPYAGDVVLTHFAATPVPEPALWVGLVALSALGRRRRRGVATSSGARP